MFETSPRVCHRQHTRGPVPQTVCRLETRSCSSFRRLCRSCLHKRPVGLRRLAALAPKDPTPHQKSEHRRVDEEKNLNRRTTRVIDAMTMGPSHRRQQQQLQAAAAAARDGVLSRAALSRGLQERFEF
ncbi:hypothetical protein PAXRUDRAFT_827862 [Paxillus rubicundulus Ve08.2h10]|uniref:Uncharacterized protein n=1 Tax=Paxillus rubicundulus Ve08.2h10 TaxID=930991 RepID=A0A0D0DX44_9AGAM|nr:hypothetical protein PAXRUDRAFT_827862 [Paxillus rubicundulus Ve08.2h10]